MTTNYWINALGQRVRKNQGTAATSVAYVYGPSGQVEAEYSWGSSAWTHYLRLPGGEPVGLVRGGQVYMVHTDHLGRPEVATNAAKSVVWRASNYAFDRTVTTNSIGGLNLGFPGQYWDAESGLWYNHFRSYDPKTGRYIESDPIGLGGGLNTYAYVGGNPIRWIDPLGLQSTPRMNEWAANNMSGNPTSGSLGNSALLDTLNAWGDSIKAAFVDMPMCTLSCGANATIGITPGSFVENRIEDAGFKLLDKAGKRAIADATNACMSNAAEKIGAKLIGKVTPGVNILATGYDVYQFGACTLKCGP